MNNCTRAFFKEIVFMNFFGTLLAKDRFLGQNFRFFGYIAISAKILKDFSKKNIFKKTKLEQKIRKKMAYIDDCAPRGYIGVCKTQHYILFG